MEIIKQDEPTDEDLAFSASDMQSHPGENVPASGKTDCWMRCSKRWQTCLTSEWRQKLLRLYYRALHCGTVSWECCLPRLNKGWQPLRYHPCPCEYIGCWYWTDCWGAGRCAASAISMSKSSSGSSASAGGGGGGPSGNGGGASSGSGGGSCTDAHYLHLGSDETPV